MPSIPNGNGGISIGQARNECGQGGGFIAASNAEVSRLAGVSPGQRFAWSWWANKTFLPQVDDFIAASVSAHVDRINELYINLQTGGTRNGSIFGDHGPGWNSIATTPVPKIEQYRGWRLWLVRTGGNARMNVCIIQQPNPGNWECMIRFDDQGSDSNIAGQPGNIQGNGANMNGATDTSVDLHIQLIR
jgi:hypothetical protein